MSQFETQTLLTITVETSYSSLGSATVKRILFVKPNGSKGYWAGTVAGTTLTYQVQTGDIDQAGIWKFQSYIEVGGLIGFGNIVTHNFEKPLT